MNVLTRARQLTRRWLGAMLAGIVLLTLAPLSALPAQAASVSETEPNGSRSTADVVNIGDTVSASASSSSSTDYDYYAVDLPSPGRVALNLKFPSNLGAGYVYNVDVYNSVGDQLYHFDITGDRYNGSWLAAQGTFAPAGRLYVSIYGKSSWASWGKTYTLTPGFTAGRVEQELNYNRSRATVTPVGSTISGSSLSHWSDDTDYYAIDLPKAGRLALNLKFPSNLGAGDVYDIDVYNLNGEQLYHFDITGNRYNGSWLKSQPVSLGEGRSYVRVYGQNNWASWGKTYTLAGLRTLTATPTPTISGTAKVGKTLTAKPGTWKPAPVTLSYQWLRSGKAISGATKSTYKLVKADKGKKVAVQVTGAKSTYASVSKKSAAKTIG